MGFSIFRKKPKRPDNMLPSGWQFYTRPNNSEPPGAIFRIDSHGTKYRVHQLKPKIDISHEPGASKIEKIDTKIGILARILGLEQISAKLSGGKVRILEFEIVEPVRYSTTDVEIDKVLKPYLTKMEFKKKNTYYIIRESRSATNMKYRLSDDQFGEIGGNAKLTDTAKAGLKISAKSEGINEICQDFPERLGVMFLPEEIAPVRQSLAAGEIELGRVPVKKVLEWTEPDVE